MFDCYACLCSGFQRQKLNQVPSWLVLPPASAWYAVNTFFKYSIANHTRLHNIVKSKRCTLKKKKSNCWVLWVFYRAVIFLHGV